MLYLSAKTHKCFIKIAKLLAALIFLDTHTVFHDIVLKISEVLQLIEEEHIYLGYIVYHLKRDSALDSLKHREDSSVIRYLKALKHGKIAYRRGVEGIKRYLRSSDSLHKSHLEAGSYRHYLTRSLHLRSELTARACKLLKGPLREFYDRVVNRRLKASAGLARNIIGYLIKSIAQSDLGGYLCYRISSSLTCESRGTGYTGVDLDDRVIHRIRIKRELTVTSANDSECGNNVKRCVAKHLIFLGRKCHRGSDNYRVTRMDSNGVYVFHTAYRDSVTYRVTHYLKLYFLPAEDILLNEYLRDGRCVKSVFSYDSKLLFAISNASACSAESKRGTNDNGISYPRSYHKRTFNIVSYIRGDTGLTYLLHSVLKELSVLCLIYRSRVSTEQTHVMLLEESLVRELHSEGKTRLSAKSSKKTVGLFFFYNSLDRIDSQRLEIYLICHSVICHYSCGVGVYENYVYSCLLKHVTRLSARIVKFGSLSDNDRT